MDRDIYTWRDLIDWCREKLEFKRRWSGSDKYKQGYEDAMRAIMSKLSDIEHKERENKAREVKLNAIPDSL